MTAEGPLPTSPASRRIHQEILQLSALVVVALISFVGTRAMAEHSRQASLTDAAHWYQRGTQAVVAGDSAAAADAFRRATVMNRGERSYAMALARALEMSGDAEAAERTLLALRESAPEDAYINLELARLAADRRDSSEAMRYYRNALYAPSTAANSETRRAIRMELIRMLQADNDKSPALAELLAAVADSPNDVESALELGRLLMEAGDDRRAADQFARALSLDPHNINALTGAGTAAFRLGRYADARRYFRTADARDSEAAGLLVVADLIAASDPLGPRLGSAERQRRLVAALLAVKARLDSCSDANGAQPIAREIDTFVGRPRPLDREADTLAAGLELVDRGEERAAACREASPLDRALVLIVHLHGAAG